MQAFIASTHVIQPHIRLRTAVLCQKEDRLGLAALGARVIQSTRQRRIGNNVRYDVGQFAVEMIALLVCRSVCERCTINDLLKFMLSFVDVDTARFGPHLVVAVAAPVQQHFVHLVLFGVQHVVALQTESDADEFGSIVVSNEMSSHFIWDRLVFSLTLEINNYNRIQSNLKKNGAECFELLY